MSNTAASIATYDELLVEKERLTLLFATQKQEMRTAINDIKRDLRPANLVFSAIKGATKSEKSTSVFYAATGRWIDVILMQLLPKKLGWLPKMLVSYFAKSTIFNYAAKKVRENFPLLKKILEKLL